MQGRVKYYLAPKGYGFIICDEHPDKDIFVHVNDILLGKYDYLQADQVVAFTLKTDEQGRLCGKHVSLVPDQEQVERPAAAAVVEKREEPDPADSARPYIQVGNGPRQYMRKKTHEFERHRAIERVEWYNR